MDNSTALVVNGQQVGLRDLIHGYKVRHGAHFLEEAVTDAIIRQEAEALGAPGDDELQQAADEFRRAAGLYEVGDTEAWLKQQGISLEEWEERLTGELLYRRVRDKVTATGVEDFFATNRAGMDRATICQIVVEDEDIAAELLAQINEEGVDFGSVAREYSIDERSKQQGGYVGTVVRPALGAEAEALVFGAGPGKVVGPAKTPRGWAVIRVEAITPASLDDETREQIKDALFHQWLRQQREKAKVEIPLLEEV